MLNCENGSMCRVASALVSASAQFCPFELECEAFVDGAVPYANWQIFFSFLLSS